MKKNKSIPSTISGLTTLVILGTLFNPARAAGNASYSLSPASGSHNVGSSFSVTVYENSGSETVNAVEAILAYNPAKLQFVSVSTSGSPFTTCTQTSGGGGSVNIVCARLAGTTTGSQLVGKVTFKALAATGSTTITFGSSSHIIRSPDTVDIWNGNTAGGTYVLKTPSSNGGETPSTGGSKPPASTPNKSNKPPQNKPAGGSTPEPSEDEKDSETETETDKPDTANEEPTKTGYLVAVRVTDKKGNPITNATVALGDLSATTDETGVASFTEVPSGSYEISVDSAEGAVKSTVTVAEGDSPLAVQEFQMVINEPFSWFWIATAAGVTLLGGLGLWLWRSGSLAGTISRLRLTKGQPTYNDELGSVAGQSGPNAPDDDETLAEIEARLANIKGAEVNKPGEVVVPPGSQLSDAGDEPVTYKKH